MEGGMKTRTLLSAGLAASMILLSGIALAQDKPAECYKGDSPQKVDGKVLQVDPDKGKMTMQGPKGETYEFNASKETLQSYKVGDRIQATLRADSKCKQQSPS
jgi:hypothetical protein